MSMMMRRKMMVRAASGLPAEYQRVEYIESSGTQYIDTGIIFNTGIKINAMMAYVSFASAQTLFGARTTTGRTRFYVTYSKGLDFAYGSDHTLNGYSVAANKIAAITYDTTDISTFKYGVTGTMSSLTIGTPVNPNTTGYIFAYHRASDNTANGFSKSRFYSMTITDANDKMLFDGIPCIRIMDSKPGIYDLVNRRFLTNAGTGEFIAGPDVGANLLLPFSEWLLKQSRGTTTIDEQGRLVFNATSNSSWNLYAIMQGRTLTYAEMYRKRYRVTLVVDSISIGAGNVGVSAGPDFTDNANPTSPNQRSYMASAVEYFGGTITEPGEYSYEFVCDTENLTAGSVDFHETDKLGASVFLNARAGSSAVISKLEVREVL